MPKRCSWSRPNTCQQGGEPTVCKDDAMPIGYRSLLVALTATMVALLASVAPGVSATPPLQSKPCTAGEAKAPALCGTFTVYEDRAASTGRTLQLHFILIKAQRPSHRVIAFNPGGPGASAIENASAFVDDQSFAKLRNNFDILLLDVRGTGASAPQQCDFAPVAHRDLYFKQIWPDALVKACRERLAAHADLSLYSTAVAADDLDDLRAALGYDKLALFGGSYGTRLYLAYARQHPDRVEGIVLDGVAPLGFDKVPLPYAAGAQAAMDGLIAACAAEKNCNAHFPALKAHFAALVRRFDVGPIRVSLDAKSPRLMLSKEVFVEALRHALYQPGTAANLPVIIERAYGGNYTALAGLVEQVTQEFADVVDGGLFLSVTCAEDLPFVTEAEVVRSSVGTFEGDARVRAQQRACAIWNVRPVPSSFVDPVRSDLPMLLLSAGDDPATPASLARQALPYLPNAMMMLVPGASHDSDYPPCVYDTMVTFFETDTTAHLSLDHCAATYRRPTFATLAYYESAPGARPVLTARFHKILTEMLAARIDRTQLTPAVAKIFTPDTMKGIAANLSGVGALETFVYRGATKTAKGTAYVYLAHFAEFDARLTVTLDASGKIADMDISPA